MKLIVEPESGVTPVLTAIKAAKKSIDVLIFRLDRSEVAQALQAAVVRGVHVRALTAHTNRGGDKRLRKLEMQLLEGGVTVSRTADDLVRYHGKMMIVDDAILHVYGFNFTTHDMERSRSFGVITRNKRLVAEAQKLFNADFDRQPYVAGYERIIVSPENSRDRLAAFLRAARREILIYDPHVTDDMMLKILSERAKAGVDVKIIGKVESKWELKAERFPGKNLHVRAIVRDGRRAFIGSQSLRKLELDKRREVGVVIANETIVRQIQEIFAEDWAETASGKKELKKLRKLEKKSEKKAEKEAAA